LIGIIQTTEALKYLIRDGTLLTNRLFLWDGLELHAGEIAVERNPACPVCTGTTLRKPHEGEEMTIKVRFFARFRELLGTDILVEKKSGIVLAILVKEIAQKKKEGYDAIFDGNGKFREFVIVMRNGKRLEPAETLTVTVADGDEIAIFPPVAGG
jgi:molybdopterin synthase sulfur carrier subunit